jgi:TPR repeat protein
VERRLLQAAEAGDARAQCNLGILLDNGLDDNGYAVAGTRPQAVRWLLAAAEQGLPRAQVKLAEVYAEGPDLSGSYATACGWFLLAAMGLRGIHLDRARSGYDRVASHLTPEQIAEAMDFARDWAPKPSKQAAHRARHAALSAAGAETTDTL